MWPQAGGATRRLPAAIAVLRISQCDGFEKRTRIWSVIRPLSPRAVAPGRLPLEGERERLDGDGDGAADQ